MFGPTRPNMNILSIIVACSAVHTNIMFITLCLGLSQILPQEFGHKDIHVA